MTRIDLPQTCTHKVPYDQPCGECNAYFARQSALDGERREGEHHELPDFALLSLPLA